MGSSTRNRYVALVEKVFRDSYTPGCEDVPFHRQDLVAAAVTLGIELPKNLGDVLYSIRYRAAMPATITATQPAGKVWVIEGTGRSTYTFRLVPINRIRPNPLLQPI
ncbi:MAG: hypothetical protein AMXMBFR64_20640 [Myxococcales bacterium]